MGELALKLPRGLRDWPPREMAKRAYVEQAIRRMMALYGYEEVCTPIFERFELFALRSGEEIRNRMFVFRTDEGEMALRPELTAPVARMIASGKLDISKRPLRLFYIGPCYRYDEPQAGRYREFWQAGVELIGSAEPEADAEVIRLATRVLEELGLKGWVLRVGDMSVVRAFLAEAGVPEEVRNRIVGPLDAISSSASKLSLYREKLARGEHLAPEELADLVRRCDEVRLWKEEELARLDAGESPLPRSYESLLEPDPRVYRLRELHASSAFQELCDLIDQAVRELLLMAKLRWAYYGFTYECDGERVAYKLPPEVADELFRLMEVVGPREQALQALRDLFGSSGAVGEAISRFQAVLDALTWFGIRDYVVDMSIVRGLEYYTGTVFEIDFPPLGAQKQVCGGGRYDRLIEEFGGPSLPAVGFAFGIDRLVLAMELSGVSPELAPRCDVYVVPVSPEVLAYAAQVAELLRSEGIRAELELARRRLRDALSMADRLGARLAVIIGPREVEQGQATLRDMARREQVSLPLADLPGEVRKRLAA